MGKKNGLLRGVGAFGIGMASGWFNEYDKWSRQNKDKTYDDFYKQTKLGKWMSDGSQPEQGVTPPVVADSAPPVVDSATTVVSDAPQNTEADLTTQDNVIAFPQVANPGQNPDGSSVYGNPGVVNGEIQQNPDYDQYGTAWADQP